MTKTTPEVGDVIDARCTKCQKVTNHLIVAMVGAKPVNVECNTCKGTHRYRNPEVVRKPAKRSSDTPTVRPEEWANLKTATTNIVAKDYHMDMDCRAGAVIRHPSFGLGLVQRIVGNRKMEVLFEDGKKMMRCR